MNISDVRQQFPQYSDLSDKQLADALHAKFYPDLPLDDFYAKVGLGGKRATVGGAFMGGLEGLLSSMQTGAGAATGSAEEAALAGRKRGQERADKYGEATSLERVKQAYNKDGLLSAAGEVFRQVPTAIAEQAPNIAATLGSAKLGAMAGTAVAPGIGTLIGGGLGAFAPGALQMFGSNVERQAAEQQRAGKQVAIDTGSAALAAAPQAALDVAATFIPMGRTVIGKVLGPKVEQLLARGAQESAEKLAKESLTSVITKGTLVGGAAEIPTEITQQMLERAQAGLSLTDEDALKEYGETAYSVGLLAPIGGVGRYTDRAAARDVAEDRRRVEEAKAQAAAVKQAEQDSAAKAQYMQTPEYLDDITQRYNDLQNKVAELRKTAKTKVDANDLAGKEAQRQAGRELAELQKTEEFTSTVQEFLKAQPLIKERDQAKVFEEQKAEVMKTPGAQQDLFGGMPTITDMSTAGQLAAFDKQLAELDKQAKTATTPQQQQAILNQRNAIEQRMYSMPGLTQSAQNELAQLRSQPPAATAEEARAAMGQQRYIEESPQSLVPSQEEFEEARRRIEALQLKAQTKFAESTDTATAARASEEFQRLEQAKAELEKFAPYIPKQPKQQKTPYLADLQKKLQKARELGDMEAAAKLLPQVQALEEQPDLFGSDNKRFAQEEALANEIAQGREKAEAARQRLEAEKAALERIRERSAQEEGSTAWALQQKKLEQARADYANYQKLLQLREEAAKLKELYGSEQEIERLQNEMRQLRGLPIDQVARDNRAAELRRRIGDLELKLEGAQSETRFGPSAREGSLLQKLRSTETELDALQRQIAAAESTRDQTAVADNILTEASDERVGKLVDRLLNATTPQGEAPSTPITASLKAQTRQSQEKVAGQSEPLRKQIEELRKNPRKNKDQIANLEQQIADIEAGGMQGNMFAPLMAEPAAEDALEKQKPTTRSRMVELGENTADAFDQLYFELEKRGDASPQVVAERRKQLERAVVTEIDFKLQSANAPAMNRAERNQLKQELDLLVDDMLRVGITRNADNSYALGQVEGMTIVAVPAEGSLSTAQLTDVQNQLAEVRNQRMSALEPQLAKLTDEITSLGRMAGMTGNELTAFVEQQMLGSGPQSLRSSIASAQQKERELSALLSGYIEGKNLQRVVVPTMYAASARVRDLNAQLSVATANGDKTKIDSINKELELIEKSYTSSGSNAPLSQRALGNIKSALPVLEDQLSGIVRRFSTDFTTNTEAREAGATRVQVAPIEAAADMLTRIQQNQFDINTLNAYIKKAGTPKAGPAFDALKAVIAQRDMLVQAQKNLRTAYNAKAERDQQTATAEEGAPTTQDAIVGMGATPQQLAGLDTRLAELRRLRQEVVDARSREGQVGRSAKEQALLDKYAKEGPALITQYDNEIDRLTRMRQKMAPQEMRMQGAYNEARRAEQEAGYVGDEAERAEMQRELDTINRQLENLTVTTSGGRIQQQLEAARDELQAKLSFQGPAPKEGRVPQRVLPGIATGAAVEVKPVAEERMTQARTDMVEARTKVETLKDALQRTGTEPQYFSEVAQRLRNEVEAYYDERERDPGNLVLQRLEPSYRQKMSEVLYFEVLAANTEDQTTARANVQTALDKATADMARTEAAYKALSERQRKYETQEDVRRGAAPGQRAAERIQAGKGEGFVTPKGGKVFVPKSAASWDIKKDSTTKTPTVQQTKSAVALARAAQTVLERTEPKVSAAKQDAAKVQTQIAALTAQKKAVDEKLAQIYPEAVAQATADEITQIEQALRTATLAQAPASPLPTEEITGLRFVPPDLKAFNTIIETTNSATQKAAGEIGYTQLLVDNAFKKLQAALNRLEKDGKKSPGKLAGLTSAYEAALFQYNKAQETLLDTKEAYLVARRSQLQLLQGVGYDLQLQQRALTSALAEYGAQLPQAQQTVSALEKERDALQAKLDKATEEQKRTVGEQQLAKDKERQERNKALDAAADARAALQRAKEGLGLAGTRVTRDTAGAIPAAVQADIKRQIASAETELGKVESNPRATAAEITAAKDKIVALNQSLDTLYSMVPPTATPIYEGDVSATQDALTAARERLEDLEQGGRATTAQIENARQRVSELEAAAQGPQPAEGMRLPERRVGPMVRNISGSKKLIQGGMQKLRASGLSQEAANSVTIAHYTVQLEENPDSKTAKNKLDAATKGMTQDQVDAAFEEGVRLIGSGPTLEMIAKRETLRQADITLTKAEKDLAYAQDAKDPAMVKLAEDGVAIAKNNRDRAIDAYNIAKELREAQFVKRERTSTKQAALDAELDAAFDSTSVPLETDLVAPEKSKIQRKTGRVVFRTATTSGPGMQVSAVRRLVERIISEWTNVPNIVLAEEFDSLPDNIKEQAIADGVQDTFPGVYDPITNTTYLVADRLHTAEDVIATLAHEISGHFGLRSIMGQDFPRIMESLYKGNKTVRDLADAKIAETPNLPVMTAVEEVLADMAEKPTTPVAKGVVARVVAFIKNALKRLSGQTVSDDYVRQIIANANRYVTTGGTAGPGGRYTGGPVFRSKNTPSSSIVGQKAASWDNLRGNLFGLGGRVQFVDRLGAADEGIVRAQNAGVLSSLEAETAQYFMRLADATSQTAGQFITSGPVQIVSEKIGNSVEERYQSQTGSNLVRVAEHIDTAAKAGLGDSAEIATTVIMAGNRANSMTNGWERLNAENPAGAKAEYEMYKAKLAANPAAKAAVDAAIAEYQKYNNGLLDFLVQTGFMPKHEADRLKKVPYVPFYRVENGAVVLFTGEEKPIRIGSLTDNPDLKQLLGDSRSIMPLLTSAAQNTFMLTRAGLRNKGTHATADALFKAGFASKFGRGPGPAGTSTVRFKVNGEDYFAVIDTDTFGVPANLVVQGMEGIKTAIPLLVQMLGIPANILRKFVTRSPAYIVRQLIRDPVNAAIVGGVDGMPVLNALKEMSKMRAGRSPSEDALMRGLVVSSNVYTGDERDMQKFLEDISTGKGKWDKLLGLMDTAALQSDAATRAVVYQDSLKKGFTTRQAEYRALEVQNFSRRGLSPSMQWLSVMVPFFNAQIQGLDVLYRSFRGKMPFSERLEIQRKIIARGSMLFVGTLAYAMMMQDDEEYLKATPEERYGNFFVHIPGVKDALKIPIPYEAGILFKALPEAIVNVAMGDAKAKEAIKGLGMLLWQSTPGVVPLGTKPILEAAYGQTPFGPIESAREKELKAAERYRENTPEVLKLLGGLTGAVGVSPLMLEHFVRGYTSSLGVSLLHVFDPVLAEQGLSKATTGASKTPFIGGLFQTADGRFLIERAYERMEEINQVANTYKKLASSGRTAEAEAMRQNYLGMLEMANSAGSFKQRMGDMFSQERAIRDDRRLTTEQKDKRIEQLKAAQNKEAREFYAATERTTPR
jgi:hypothetical protein